MTEKTETKPEDIAFSQRLEKAFNEALELKLKGMEKKFDEMIDAKLKALEIEAEHVLRKGLGVEQDPVVHTSDLIREIRKATLANAEKTTPTSVEKAGPEGNKEPSSPFDAMLKPFSEVKA